MKISSKRIYLSIIILSLFSATALQAAAPAPVCIDCVGSISFGIAARAPFIVGPSGAKVFTMSPSQKIFNFTFLDLQPGSTYRFSTCTGTSEDTYMYMSIGHDIFICNEDFCGQQSRFDFTPKDTIVAGGVLQYTLNVRSPTCKILASDVDITVTLISIGGGPGGGPGTGTGGPPFTPPPSVNLWQASGTSGVTTSRDVGIGLHPVLHWRWMVT